MEEASGPRRASVSEGWGDPCNPGSIINRFTMKNCQVPEHAHLAADPGPDEQKPSPTATPRCQARAEVEAPWPDSTFSKRWDMMVVEETAREEPRPARQALLEIAERRASTRWT
jgi:hypothetical protein